MWESSKSHYAWSWLKLEAEAACVRQNVTSEQWLELREFTDYIGYIDISPEEVDDLLRFNRVLGLRAADAAHLFCFSKLAASFQGLHLVSFDKEILSVAQKLRYSIHPVCLSS